MEPPKQSHEKRLAISVRRLNRRREHYRTVSQFFRIQFAEILKPHFPKLIPKLFYLLLGSIHRISLGVTF